MKRTQLLRRMLALCLVLCCAFVLTACGETKAEPTPAPDNGAQAQPLVFVGADKTNWDKALGIGEYSYNIALILNDDGTVTMNATCAGAGPSGEPESAEDFSAHDFTQTGTWEKEEGYGYTVTLGDYTTKTDYEKTSSRQYMYIEIKNGEDTSGLVQLLAKDTNFRKEIAADYDIFEARDAKYTFKANGTSGNGNATQTLIYLENDGSANVVGQQGSSTNYTRGSWTENDDKSLTVQLGANTYTADYCDVEGREGYRLTYNNSTMYSNDIDYTPVDFEGETLRTLYCGQRDYTVALTEKGFATIYNSSDARVTSGRYTEDGDTMTVVLNGATAVSANGSITLSFSAPSAGGFGPSGGGSSTVERTFPIDGSMPDEIVDDASGESNASGEADASSETASAETATGEASSDASAETAAPAVDASGEPSGEPVVDASGEPAA